VINDFNGQPVWMWDYQGGREDWLTVDEYVNIHMDEPDEFLNCQHGRNFGTS